VERDPRQNRHLPSGCFLILLRCSAERQWPVRICATVRSMAFHIKSGQDFLERGNLQRAMVGLTVLRGVVLDSADCWYGQWFKANLKIRGGICWETYHTIYPAVKPGGPTFLLVLSVLHHFYAALLTKMRPETRSGGHLGLRKSPDFSLAVGLVADGFFCRRAS